MGWFADPLRPLFLPFGRLGYLYRICPQMLESPANTGCGASGLLWFLRLWKFKSRLAHHEQVHRIWWACSLFFPFSFIYSHVLSFERRKCCKNICTQIKAYRDSLFVCKEKFWFSIIFVPCCCNPCNFSPNVSYICRPIQLLWKNDQNYSWQSGQAVLLW